ncbi:MAG: hypothetical protein LBH60_02210 [Prevotellaceae bacterium]|nr:hypothetical protein [Prevotellaceae bacterium]
MGKKVFRSRISILLMGLILALFLFIAVPVFCLSIAEGFVMSGLLALVFGGILLLVSGFSYVITGNELCKNMAQSFGKNCC